MEHMNDINVTFQLVHGGRGRSWRRLVVWHVLRAIPQPPCDLIKAKRFRPLFTIAVHIGQHPCGHGGAPVLTFLLVTMPDRQQVQFVERQSPKFLLTQSEVATGIGPELAPVDPVDEGSAWAASVPALLGSAACVAFVHASVTA